jgi:acyl-CoA dehydrogenase
MANIISVLVLMGLIFAAAFYRLSSIIWTVLIGIALLIITGHGYLTPILLILCWLIYLPAACFANLRQLRKRYIIQPALKLLKAKLPTISRTERIAIEAGDTWWEKELFCGRPDWKKLYDTPRPALSQEEEAFLNHQVEHVCSLVSDWDIIYKDHDLPQEVWAYLKKEKFFSMVLPKQYGGLGFSALAHSTVVTKLATRSISLAVTTMVPNSLGPAELLVRYGTEEQKDYYLPRLATAEDIPCFALTAPDAGSDAGAIPDAGIICRGQYEGKEIIGIRVNWDKRYITLAPVTTLIGLAIHLYDPEHLLGDKSDVGITLCLIPASHPGVETGARHLPMYAGFMNGPTRGKDVFIPLDWIIGGTHMAGQGWRMLMESLSIGRSISLPALSTGCGKLAFRATGAYAKIRRQFNTAISSFEGVEEALGYIAGYTYMLEACRIMTAGAVDQHINPSIVSAIAKYNMTKMCRQVVSHAMDVHGGQTIQTGPRNLLANVWMTVPISITVEGANILTRNLIIFGQGAIRCHPYLLKEIELISATDTNINKLDKVLMSHIGYFMSNLIRSFAYGLTGGRFIYFSSRNKKIKRCKRQLTRMSTALALLSDASLILLGGSLKRRERLSARLGDIMSQLYLASTVLKYYYDNNNPETDMDYVEWAVHECLYNIQLACDSLLNNFPQRILGKILKFIVFPFGPAYHQPKDKLHNKLVDSMLHPSEFRDRITKYSYVGNDALYRLDEALSKVADIEPLQKKLQKALHDNHVSHAFNFAERMQYAQQSGVLSAEEITLLTAYEKLRNDIIQVNEFSFDLSKVLA